MSKIFAAMRTYRCDHLNVDAFVQDLLKAIARMACPAQISHQCVRFPSIHGLITGLILESIL